MIGLSVFLGDAIQYFASRESGDFVQRTVG
jgi:hypothetical protein